MLHWETLCTSYALHSSDFYSTPIGRFFRGRDVVVVAPTAVLILPDSLGAQLSRHLFPPLPSASTQLGFIVINCATSFCRYLREQLENKQDRILFDSAFLFHGIRQPTLEDCGSFAL